MSTKTWNPIIGCAKVSSGCKNCYAETLAAVQPRKGAAKGQRSPYLNVLTDAGRWNGRAVFLPQRLAEPLSWRQPTQVFVNSMSDLFHEDLSFEQIAAVFGVMAATRRHTYQVLTKRPGRMLEFFGWLLRQQGGPRLHVVWAALHSEAKYGDAQPLHEKHCADPEGPWPLPNVWLGVSVEDQRAASERIPLLLRTPAAVRFVSCEPLLGPIDLAFTCFNGADSFGSLPGLDWVIVGGESGRGARACDATWVESIIKQCRGGGVACFVKQLGARPLLVPECLGCEGTMREGQHCERCGDEVELDRGRRVRHLRDRKGGDPSEWPSDLRVREMPRLNSSPEPGDASSAAATAASMTVPLFEPKARGGAAEEQETGEAHS